MDLDAKKRVLQAHLQARGVPMSLEEEMNALISRWVFETGIHGRAAACMVECLQEIEDGRPYIYTREEWEDREGDFDEELNNEIRDREAAEEASADWEALVDERESDIASALERVEEFAAHVRALGEHLVLRCSRCGDWGCDPDCQAFLWAKK